MGLWTKGINKSRKSNLNTDNPKTENQEVPQQLLDKKEIDWEERHFQICLALLSRTDVTSYHNNTVSTVKPKLSLIIETADQMVELLKKAVGKEQPDLEPTIKPEAKSDDIIEEKVTSDEKPKGAKSSFLEMFEEAESEDIWKALQDMGYTKGSDIPYFHFNECCEELSIDVDTIDIEKFAERYDVNIG